MSVISREAAIQEIRKYFMSELDKEETHIQDGWEVYANIPHVTELLTHNKQISIKIKSLPTAEKVGKWINEETNYLCSECLRGCWVNSDYCPWCGARMRGEEDETEE